MPTSLATRQLIVVTGKGGVGKTSVAAVLGSALAAAGRRTLVAEVDPRENLHRMLGVPPSGGEILRAGGKLWVQNLSPQRVIDDLVREQLKFDLIARRVLASPIYQHFTAGAPGLKEMAVLGHALRVLRGEAGKEAPAIDTVILDAPATGHGVALLAAPLLVSEAVHSGPIHRMSAEVAELIADPVRSGIVAVTLAEEMPVQEVIELAETLRTRVGREPELLVANGLFPPLPKGEATPEDTDPGAPTADPAGFLWRHRRASQERELARLVELWPGGRIDLSQLPLAGGPELVAALRREAEAQAAWGELWS
ncbi:MAG TPA: ArsA family ATPase [Thermoanaerobaculia bacterium]|jgi:anion-transporting  ArsA/GET3 family ATPase|nr:ArsA family ATPase [Thermoanaerobaculia bacterium]